MRKKLKINYSKEITFADGCDEYLNDCKARNLREGTLKHYRESIKSISRFIEPNTLIKTIDSAKIQEFIIECKEKLDIKDITLYTYCRDLKTLMYFFMRCGYVKTYKIKLVKADKEPIEIYTDYELKALLKKPNLKKASFSEYKAWVIVSFLLSTGLRMNSLINIKIKDVDFYNEMLTVSVTKNRKFLMLPLNNSIIKILKEYLKIRQYENENDYLFCNVYGKQLVKSTLYHSLVQYHKSRGISKTGIHRYRHTFAKKWIMEGGNIITLQKILGHSSLQITENYLNVLISDLKRELDEFNIIDEFNYRHIKIER